MKKSVLILFALSGLILAACSSSTGSTPTSDAATRSLNSATPTAANLTRTNDEAMVTVKVTPLNLDDRSAEVLTFSVVLDTHSVELDYDLKSIGALSTDTGETVQPTDWTGPPGGGHHKEGVLAFPSLKNRGQSLTLVLRGIAGVPERQFIWKVK